MEGVSQAGLTDSGQSHCSSMSQSLDGLPSALHSVTYDHKLNYEDEMDLNTAYVCSLLQFKYIS